MKIIREADAEDMTYISKALTASFGCRDCHGVELVRVGPTMDDLVFCFHDGTTPAFIGPPIPDDLGSS
mgnify:CR=1 FL=1